jgi:hypothetical protein
MEWLKFKLLWWEVTNPNFAALNWDRIQQLILLTIMPVVCGCGLSFKASGLQNHQRQSLDIRCKDREDDPHDIINNILEKKILGATVDQMDVDPTGDYFGDYNDYDMEVGTENPVEELMTTDEEDSDDDFDNGLNLTMEFLEPERKPHSAETHPPAPENQVDEAPEDSSAKGKVMRLRGGAEMELRKEPFIVKFPNARAGAVHPEHVVDENLNASYTRKVGSAENPFFPFSSKMEWEIAQWAKMRGPSSTSFTELMNIEGVSFFTIHL